MKKYYRQRFRIGALLSACLVLAILLSGCSTGKRGYSDEGNIDNNGTTEVYTDTNSANSNGAIEASTTPDNAPFNDSINDDTPEACPFTEELEQDIFAANSGETLAEVAENLRYQEYESVVGFDSTGKKVFDYTSNISSTAAITTEIYQEFLNQDGVLVLHNHPIDESFSGGDVYSGAIIKAWRMMVVGAEHVYLLEPGIRGWGEPESMQEFYYDRYAEYIDKMSDYLTQFYYMLEDDVLAIEEPEDEESLEWYCLHTLKESILDKTVESGSINVVPWICHQTMLDLAEEYDLQYGRYDYDGFNFDNEWLFTTGYLIYN